MLFGTTLTPWIERLSRENRWVRDLLSDTYSHGYFWMILLVFLAYLRRDNLSMRWVFMSVSITYLMALLITLLLPSYGLFFLEPDRFEWITGEIRHSQTFLLNTYSKNMPLLEHAQTIRAVPFGGIAAFPSLHIGHMTVLVLIAMRLSPVYALWMMGILFLTFLATLAFGWHYAVDALGGVFVAMITTVTMHRIIFNESYLSGIRKLRQKSELE